MAKVMAETFSCDAFEKEKDGSWRCVRTVTIKGARGLIQLPVGMSFTKGIPYMGVEVAERLDEECS